jgi:hypothetical protein
MRATFLLAPVAILLLSSCTNDVAKLQAGTLIKEDTPEYSIEVQLPDFSVIADEASKEKVTTALRSLMDEEVLLFKSEFVSNAMEHGYVGKNTLDGECSLSHASVNIASILCDMMAVAPGAPYPIMYTRVLTYSFPDNKILNLYELFDGRESMMQLSTIITLDLRAQAQAKGVYDEMKEAWMKEGVRQGFAVGFNTYVLTPTGASVFFDPNEVGTYAEGRYRVDLPIITIEPILAPGAAARW